MQTGIGTSTTWPVAVNLPDSASRRKLDDSVGAFVSHQHDFCPLDGYLKPPRRLAPRRFMSDEGHFSARVVKCKYRQAVMAPIRAVDKAPVRREVHVGGGRVFGDLPLQRRYGLDREVMPPESAS